MQISILGNFIANYDFFDMSIGGIFQVRDIEIFSLSRLYLSPAVDSVLERNFFLPIHIVPSIYQYQLLSFT